MGPPVPVVAPAPSTAPNTASTNPVVPSVEPTSTSNATAGDMQQPAAAVVLPTCIICMGAPADATFVHGDTGHSCCCYACAAEVVRRGGARGAQCPVCRVRVERVIYNFYA